MIEQCYYQSLGNSMTVRLFHTKGYVADSTTDSGKESITLEKFPPFLRTLLLTDGTVTKSLEAYYWEPIIVDQLAQEISSTEIPIHELQLPIGEQILNRKVRLRGNNSGKIYTFACSLVHLNLLPNTLREGLLKGDIGIGELIRDCGLETYREIQYFGVIQEMLYSHVDDANNPSKQEIVFRSYKIIIANQPVILVTEKFPLQLYEKSNDT